MGTKEIKRGTVYFCGKIRGNFVSYVLCLVLVRLRDARESNRHQIQMLKGTARRCNGRSIGIIELSNSFLLSDAPVIILKP